MQKTTYFAHIICKMEQILEKSAARVQQTHYLINRVSFRDCLNF